MSDAVKRVTEALAGLSESEVAVMLAKLGVQRAPEPRRVAAPRMPLPAPRECSSTQ
jgi:hypothetical protein